MNIETTKEEDDAWEEMSKRQGGLDQATESHIRYLKESKQMWREKAYTLRNETIEEVAQKLEGFKTRFPGFEPDTFASFVAFIRGMKQ